jgi:predicted DNA-binding antitoxin AbrB/MazE fold protein
MIKFQATYQNGILRPRVKLDLPDNSVVQVQVMAVQSTDVTTSGSLFGAFPELAALTDSDFAWAERTWEHSVEKQSRILDELNEA